MNLNIIRFLGAILLITFATHYFLFFSWTRFFIIHDVTAKRCLLIIMFFLSVTFIISSIFIHLSNTSFTRTYYLLSGTWMGLMSFLLVATVIVWIVKGGLWFLPSGLPAATVIQGFACILYGLAVVYTGFCHYQFHKINVKSLSVPIQNLPLQWDGKKIIHNFVIPYANPHKSK